MDESEAISNEINESNDSDQIAKDKLNQRREARRRKILENAKNRLERLNGRPNTPSPSDGKPSIQIQYEHTNGEWSNRMRRNMEYFIFS